MLISRRIRCVDLNVLGTCYRQRAEPGDRLIEDDVPARSRLERQIVDVHESNRSLFAPLLNWDFGSAVVDHNLVRHPGEVGVDVIVWDSIDLIVFEVCDVASLPVPDRPAVPGPARPGVPRRDLDRRPRQQPTGLRASYGSARGCHGSHLPDQQQRPALRGMKAVASDK